jgi:adenylate cyclase
MKIRLPTVRSKLTALVATTVVMMLATLPVLSWLLHKQLIDEVDNRVEEAHKSFEQELKDDLDDLLLAAKVLAADSDTRRFLVAKDRQHGGELAKIFLGVYPDIDVLLASGDGEVVAQVGCQSPLPALNQIAIFNHVRTNGVSYRGLTDHGCEASPDAPPAYTIALPVKAENRSVVGMVVVCMPIDAAHLTNDSKKLGLELALVGPPPQHAVLDHTAGFPAGAPAELGARSTLVETGGHTFAMTRFEPPELRTTHGNSLSIVAAMDVSDIRRLVRQHLLYALLVLGLATLISVAFGTRLANIMSNALQRVNDAIKKLEVQEYAHIQGVRTGDEIEDLANGFNIMVDGLKERDKLRATFGKYMTASVMDHLMSGKVSLGGETLTVTILFTDIRSFTTLSEKMDAQALVALLNEYFTEMVGIVMSEDGVVDKYIGDAIMAVFGAPVSKPDDALRAVRAAVRMRTALVHLNERLATRGLGPLATGIGIHTGVVVAGNIGSETRMEYTVIGDAVNVASRLESATKDLHAGVLISEDTWALVHDAVDFRAQKPLMVKGRAQPVTSYEVLGMKGEAPVSPASARDRPPPSDSGKR